QLSWCHHGCILHSPQRGVIPSSGPRRARSGKLLPCSDHALRCRLPRRPLKLYIRYCGICASGNVGCLSRQTATESVAVCLSAVITPVLPSLETCRTR
ncbi:hypothetical protein FRC17_003818, partial [Serendipita sp. 399]